MRLTPAAAGVSSLGRRLCRMRGGGGGAGGASVRPRLEQRAAASRPPRPNARAVAIAAEPRISPNAIITISSARPMKVRPIAVNKATIAYLTMVWA